MRLPSEETIRRRAIVAYHRAQALARNAEYQSDIEALRCGVEFDVVLGVATGFPSGRSRELWSAICRRSGLRRPMKPDTLRSLTVESILRRPPIFVDFLGWKRVPVVEGWEQEPGRLWWAAHRTRRIESLFRYVFVPVRRLGKRHRAFGQRDAPPADLASQYWAVWDLRNEGESDTGTMAKLWPEEVKKPQKFDALRQRVYDYQGRSKKLIKDVYPPLA